MNDIYSSIEITKNNHLRYWFNENEKQHWRTNVNDIAHMSLGSNQRPTERSFVQCLTDTASKFQSKHNDQLYFFLSGGLDSEVALRSFLLAGVNINIVILKFVNDLNIEDVNNAKQLCNELRLDPIIADIDPIRFFESGEWINIAKKYQSYTFYQQLLLQAAEGLSKPMLTIDEIEIVKIEDVWMFIKKEDQDGCWHRFIEKTGIPAYNNFYTYDSDAILSFLKSPTVNKLINNELPGKLSWTSSKNEIYAELTPWRMTRRSKRHGMERMIDIWKHVEKHIAEEMNEVHKIYQIPINDLYHGLASGQQIICDMQPDL